MKAGNRPKLIRGSRYIMVGSGTGNMVRNSTTVRPTVMKTPQTISMKLAMPKPTSFLKKWKAPSAVTSETAAPEFQFTIITSVTSFTALKEGSDVPYRVFLVSKTNDIVYASKDVDALNAEGRKKASLILTKFNVFVSTHKTIQMRNGASHCEDFAYQAQCLGDGSKRIDLTRLQKASLFRHEHAGLPKDIPDDTFVMELTDDLPKCLVPKDLEPTIQACQFQVFHNVCLSWRIRRAPGSASITEGSVNHHCTFYRE